MEKDNFQDDLPQSRVLPDFKVQLNKKLQQRFSLVNDLDAHELNDEPGGGFISANTSTENIMPDTSKKRKLKPESKLRHRRNFVSLLEEEV